MRWLPHLVLLGAAALMLLVAQLKHLPTAEARQIALDPAAAVDDRVWAIHVVANRATEVDRELGENLVNALMDSEDERLREASVLIDLCRHALRPVDAVGTPPPLQEAYTYAPLPPEGWTPHRFRTYVLHRHKVGGMHVGGVRRLVLPEVNWYLAARRGDPLPPSAEIQEHLARREIERARFAEATRAANNE